MALWSAVFSMSGMAEALRNRIFFFINCQLSMNALLLYEPSFQFIQISTRGIYRILFGIRRITGPGFGNMDIKPSPQAFALALFRPDTFYRVGQRCFNGLETHRN